MKKLLLILSIAFMPQLISAQYIQAGDSLSPGVIFVDIPDEWVSSSFPSGTEAFNLDINGDGSNEITFSSYKNSTMSSTIQVTGCQPATGSSTEIIVTPDNDTWVASIPEETWIGSQSNWGEGGTLSGEYAINYEVTLTGVFSEGFIGFKTMINGQLTHGWVQAFASPGSVAIFSYAYQDVTTGINQISTQEIAIYPNPVDQDLWVTIPENQGNRLKYCIYDLTGAELGSGRISSNNGTVNCQHLAPGMYYIRITNHDEVISAHKFIKQ